MNLLLQKAKLVLRIVTTDFDSEILDLILAAMQDLGLAGVVNGDTTDPLIVRAILTYVKMNFGEIDNDVYNRLYESYWVQKSQLQMATGYTDFEEDEGEVLAETEAEEEATNG